MQDDVLQGNQGTAESKLAPPNGTTSTGNRVVRYLPYILILLAVLSGFGYVHAYGTNLFWGDDWCVRPSLLAHYADGTLTMAELWHPHNEHRIFFPKLVMLGLGVLTSGNVLADMYFSEVLLLAILALFLIACRRQLAGDWVIWLMVPIAFLVFSVRQLENMLWGFQIGFMMVVAAGLSVFLSLSRLRSERYVPVFVGAVLAATIGAYSSIQGLLIWPVGLGQLVMAPLTKRLKIVLTAIWAVIGAGQWLLYFQNWESPHHHPSLAFSAKYFLLAIGGALASDLDWGLVTGVLLLALVAAAVASVCIRREWKEQSFWLATTAFSLATMTAITIGRSGFGPHQGMSSRYATFSIPLVIAAYVIFASYSRDKANRASLHLMRVTLCLAILSVSICFVRGHWIGQEMKQEWEYQRFLIRTIDSQPDEALCTYPVKSQLREFVETTKRLKCNVFADAESCAAL